MKIPILILILLVVNKAKPKIVKCADGKGDLPKSITVLDCNNDEDCEFIRGKAVLADFEFVTRGYKKTENFHQILIKITF